VKVKSAEDFWDGDVDARTIYVVDDDEAMRDSLRWLLESAGYRVATYDSAERFLATYRYASCICLVLDVRMPGLTGLEVQQELDRRGTPTPIIFITGHADMLVAAGALNNGAFHFLEKPFNSERLLELIERVATSGTQVEVERTPLDCAAVRHRPDAAQVRGN
jgi:two-component system, LuxR family, response regulator TtrR